MNALGLLRQRLGYERDAVAARLKITLADLDTLEATPIRLLEVNSVAEHVGACECRLDLVAVHIDGEAVWLEHTEPRSEPPCPRCGLPMARLQDANGTGWICVACAGDEP